MVLRDEQVLEEVLVLRVAARDSDAAAPLPAVRIERQPLHVALVTHGHGHRVVGDQVLVDVGLDLLAADLRLAVVAEARLQVDHVVADQRVDEPCVGEDRLQPRDLLDQLLALLLELVALEAGQALQLHAQDLDRLDLAERKGLHQRVLRRVDVGRLADDPHDLVDVIDGDLQTFDDVEAVLRLLQLVARAAPDHVAAMDEVCLEHLLQVERARAVPDQRDVDHRERGLQIGELVELVQRDVRVLTLLQLDDDAHAVLVGLVAQVRDRLDALVLHEVRDRLDQRGLVDLVRDLREHDLLAVFPSVLDLGAAAHEDLAAADAVGVQDAGAAADDAAGREVGAANDLAQLVDRRLRRVEQLEQRVRDLRQVVRRHRRRHADRDAARAVAQQIRELAREDQRLFARAVIVRHEVDGRFGVEVLHQVHRGRRHRRFRVTHRGRRIAVDRTEVALPVDQRVPHDEVLRHAHERGVDDRFAVRVVVARCVAADLRALLLLRARSEVEVVHRDEHAALRRLQSVADVGQRAADDDRHRVIEVGDAHLLLDQQVLDAVVRLRHRGRSPVCSGGDAASPKDASRTEFGRTCGAKNEGSSFSGIAPRDSTPIPVSCETGVLATR